MSVTPSDAQAVLLDCLNRHRSASETVMLYPDEYRASRVQLLVGRSNHGPLHGIDGLIWVDPDATAVVPASEPVVRRLTLTAAARNGWISQPPTQTVNTQRIGVQWFREPRWIEFGCVEITDDGRIALGLWQQERLSRPVTTPLVLEGRDRDLIRIAYECKRHGFAMMPVTGAAKKDARRLARGEYAVRGFGAGASTSSLEPSAAGEVAIAPDMADGAGLTPLHSWESA